MPRRLISSFSEFTSQELLISSHHTNEKPENCINVSDCDINFDLIIANYYKDIKFTRCNFLKDLKCTNLTVKENFDFTGCNFDGIVTFADINIEGKSRFWNSKFNVKCYFNNARFKDLADFFKVKFSEVVIFYKVDFFGTTVFTETQFEKNVLFTYTKITDVVIFTRTLFDKGFDLSLAIITGKINFHNCHLKNFPDFPDVQNNTNYRSQVEDIGNIPRNNQRETYRIIKRISKEDDNQFQVLEYAKLENQVYFKQLKVDIIEKFDSYIIFLFNQLSNSHNISWTRGVAFTGSFGLIFFYSALISTSCVEFSFCFPNWEIFQSYIGMYFNFLSPIHTIDLFLFQNPNTGTIILDFFGRIFVGYGIYQTIQAFRKHKG